MNHRYLLHWDLGSGLSEKILAFLNESSIDPGPVPPSACKSKVHYIFRNLVAYTLLDAKQHVEPARHLAYFRALNTMPLHKSLSRQSPRLVFPDGEWLGLMHVVTEGDKCSI